MDARHVKYRYKTGNVVENLYVFPNTLILINLFDQLLEKMFNMKLLEFRQNKTDFEKCKYILRIRICIHLNKMQHNHVLFKSRFV